LRGGSCDGFTIDKGAIIGDRRASLLHDKSGLTIAAVTNGIQVSA
jgi:hypothetical protein